MQDNKVLSFIDIHFTSFGPTLQPEFTIFLFFSLLIWEFIHLLYVVNK